MLTIWKRIAALFGVDRLEREWSDEIETHLAMQEEEFRARGMSPGAARAAARREFGGVAQTSETYRERRGIPWIETAIKDLRYAARGLAQNRGFTAAAVISLALGIGANTAIFSMFHTLMLRLLPVSHPEELVTLFRSGAWGRGYSSYPLYLEIRKRSDLFQGVIASSLPDKARFRSGNCAQAETVQQELVSGNYFAVLGVSPALGRVFTDNDNRTPKGSPVAVLSYDFWQRHFNGDPAVVGRTVSVDNDVLTLVGVAARGFRGVGVDRRAELWEPAMMLDGNIMEPGMAWAWIMARRQPNVSRRQAQAAIDVLFRQYLTAQYGQNQNAAFRRKAMGQYIEVRPGGIGLSVLREDFNTALTVLMAAVGLVLLAACANVANLLLARGAARRKEIAVRLSLGATRARLVRQALMESSLLALAGSVLGIGLAYWGESGILQFLPASAGEPFSAAPNATVLAFTVGISLVSVALFGLLPAWRSTVVDPAECMKAGAGPGMRRTALREALVVAQVAFSVMLVALAGLFGHSLSALRNVDLGFRDQSVMSVGVESPGTWKPGDFQTARQKVMEQIQGIAGVSMVSFGEPGPFLGGFSNSSLRVLGSEVTAKEPAWVNVQKVAPGFFAILGTHPLAGREFDNGDTAKSRKVVVVNQAFVRAFLSGEGHPTDRAVNFDESKIDPSYIVGVVRDIAHRGLREKVDPTVYLPVAQSETNFGAVVVRSARPSDEMATLIRGAVAKAAPELAGSEPKTIRQRIDDSIFRDRMVATVGGFFGGLALLLAAIGLYGVMSYGTARRAREIGIRIALGARRSEVLWMVLRGALVLVAAGLAVGIPISLIAAKRVAPVLFGIKPDDSLTFWSTGIVLAAIGLGAAMVPARRAAGMEPMRVLREE